MPASLHDRATRHARVRMQQRGIPRSAVDVLLAFGCERHDGRGGVVLCLDRPARRRLVRSGAPSPDVDRLRGLYVVVSNDGAIVTVGHRLRRGRRWEPRGPARRSYGTA